MEDDTSAHYALKIAVTILRERCQHFQRRIAVLEEENLNLKTCQKNDTNENSLSQIDSLNQQIASVEEQNRQLQSKMKIISQENQQLWANLGKLTHVNKSLGSHLNKINNTLSQHVNRHQPLIRSKTFTQDKPQTAVDIQENKEIDTKLDLEDISLKLINSMSEVKNEMDSLVQDMTNVEILDNIITSSLGFSYDDDNDDIVEDLKIILEELAYVKNETGKQNTILKENLKNIKNIKDNSKCKCDKCEENNEKNDVMKSSPHDDKVLEKQNLQTSPTDTTMYYKIEKMCPVCSQQFPEEISFTVFVVHVESHFKTEDNDSC